jgi:hypothetical protein
MKNKKFHMYKDAFELFFMDEIKTGIVEYVMFTPIILNSLNEKVDCFVFILQKEDSKDEKNSQEGIYLFLNYDFTVVFTVDKKYIYRTTPPRNTDLTKLDGYFSIEKFNHLKKKLTIQSLFFE